MFLTIVVLSVLFIVGCQENSITKPVGTLEKSGNHLTRETIEMNFVIDDSLVGRVELIGEVSYTHEVVDSDQPSSQFLVLVSLDFNAELNDML